MYSSLSEESLQEVGNILDEFTRCERADGSFYGTGGTCRKGTPAGDKETKSSQWQTSKKAALSKNRKIVKAHLVEMKKKEAAGDKEGAQYHRDVAEQHGRFVLGIRKELEAGEPAPPKMSVDLNTPAGRMFARGKGYKI